MGGLQIGSGLRSTVHRASHTTRLLWHKFQRFQDYSSLRARIQHLDPEKPRKFPTIVQIESSSKCNLRCRSCRHSVEGKSGQHLTCDDLRTILDRLPFPVSSVCLSGTGEPLLNPDFFTQADILADRKGECTFYTNGTLLVPKICDQILSRPHITYMAVSCDSVRKEIFEELRVGADFDRWRQLVGDFLSQVSRLSPRHIQVAMNTVVSNRNFRELADIVRLAAELGFHRIHFLDLIPIDPEAASLYMTDDERMSIDQTEIQALGKSLGVLPMFHLRQPNARGKIRCFQPWEYIMIRPGGDVFPCCAVFGTDKVRAVGNLLREDFETVWRGEPFRRFRRTYVQGSNALCNQCPFA